jgi:hypothetical protein
VLKKKTESFIADYWPISSEVDTPKYYTDDSATQFILAPTPVSNFAYEIRYTKKPTRLSSTNSTNYYITNCSDVLFYASMVEMLYFMKAFGQLPLWESRYTNARDTWNLQQVRYRRDGETSVRNTDSSPNSLKHAMGTAA